MVQLSRPYMTTATDHSFDYMDLGVTTGCLGCQLKKIQYKNVKKINISTDVKQACLKGIQKSQEENLMHSQGFDPLKVTTNIHQSIMQMAMHYLELQEGILHE